MTTSEIITACIGFLICSGILAAITLLILAVIWYLFKHNMDFEDLEYMEDPDDE